MLLVFNMYISRLAMEIQLVKFQMMMKPSFADAVDDWRFANRIGSRAEAIRLLVKRGLEDRHTNDTDMLPAPPQSAGGIVPRDR
jgi:hypothetical protein